LNIGLFCLETGLFCLEIELWYLKIGRLATANMEHEKNVGVSWTPSLGPKEDCKEVEVEQASKTRGRNIRWISAICARMTCCGKKQVMQNGEHLSGRLLPHHRQLCIQFTCISSHSFSHNVFAGFLLTLVPVFNKEARSEKLRLSSESQFSHTDIHRGTISFFREINQDVQRRVHCTSVGRQRQRRGFVSFNKNNTAKNDLAFWSPQCEYQKLHFFTSSLCLCLVSARTREAHLGGQS